MGRRVSFARYGAALRAGLNSRGLWTVQLWERTCVAIERDDLRGKGFVEKMRVQGFDANMVAHGSANTRGVSVEDKAIRAHSHNALVMSVLSLRSPEHKRLVKLVCACCEVLSDYHSKQNKDFFLSNSYTFQTLETF